MDSNRQQPSTTNSGRQVPLRIGITTVVTGASTESFRALETPTEGERVSWRTLDGGVHVLDLAKMAGFDGAASRGHDWEHPG